MHIHYNMNKSKTLHKVFCLLFLIIITFNNIQAQTVASAKTMESMVLANKYFIEKYPDVGQFIIAEKSFPGNIWTRGVYYEGLMALYKLKPDTAYLNYALRWAVFHKWSLTDSIKTRNAYNQCSGQTYIDLYMLDRYKEERIKNIRECIDNMLTTDKIDDWDQVDALQMVMPVFARLGAIYHNEKYFDRMNEMYLNTKLKSGKNGLYSTVDHLWWRDKDFIPPYKEPNGQNCYWSRGNGWVIAALVRALDFLPNNSSYKKEYQTTLKEMFEALVPLQRPDGFWNVSLKDSTHFGGKETTGTALFVYGMAWGINEGLISKKDYMPVVMKAWNALLTESLHTNGFIGYVQGTGREPKDGQPIGYDKVPDFEDFGLGCYLLAGSEVYKLSKSLEPKDKEPKTKIKAKGSKAQVADKKNHHPVKELEKM